MMQLLSAFRCATECRRPFEDFDEEVISGWGGSDDGDSTHVRTVSTWDDMEHNCCSTRDSWCSTQVDSISIEDDVVPMAATWADRHGARGWGVAWQQRGARQHVSRPTSLLHDDPTQWELGGDILLGLNERQLDLPAPPRLGQPWATKHLPRKCMRDCHPSSRAQRRDPEVQGSFTWTPAVTPRTEAAECARFAVRRSTSAPHWGTKRLEGCGKASPDCNGPAPHCSDWRLIEEALNSRHEDRAVQRHPAPNTAAARPALRPIRFQDGQEAVEDKWDKASLHSCSERRAPDSSPRSVEGLDASPRVSEVEFSENGFAPHAWCLAPGPGLPVCMSDRADKEPSSRISSASYLRAESPPSRSSYVPPLNLQVPLLPLHLPLHSCGGSQAVTGYAMMDREVLQQKLEAERAAETPNRRSLYEWGWPSPLTEEPAAKWPVNAKEERILANGFRGWSSSPRGPRSKSWSEEFEEPMPSARCRGRPQEASPRGSSKRRESSRCRDV
eukprot:gnl/TRDRNA2_/TRDRNA2_97070_c0_seq1.p1 gnl/TRDRNA2_/TRDRNA2_97070_c0~~gnl/TRDRNA2_/TRDRNA2_97070_c0_seq1.p1  ORF type:complete len:500 (+),score=46.04 gnl/TRDRNA2_/TRDRNA2_97070_c0_seq1:167-1666(+)